MTTEEPKENHAFIDGQNLHSGVRALGWKIDHKKFRQYLRDEFGVTKAYMFVGYMEEHQDLYNALQEAGFICFFKPLLRYEDGSIKGNVDADMVLQVMVDIDNFEKAVIVTGDGDFAGLIRHLASVKKLGQVIIPNSRNYSSLFERMDEFGKDKKFFTFMDNLRTKLLYNPSGRPVRNFNSSKNHGTQRKAPPKTTSKPSVKSAPNAAKPVSKTPNKNTKPSPKSAKQPAKKGAKPQRKRMTYKEKLESSLIESINNAAD